MADLWEELFGSPGDTALHVLTDGGGVDRWSGVRLLERSERVAAGLAERGIEPGTRVAAIVTNTPEACTSVFGAWLAGAVVVSVPVIARGTSLPDYRRQLGELCEAAGSPFLLVEAKYAPFLDGLGVPVVTHEELPGGRRAAASPPAGDEVAFVQYSSGSTRSPRGCAITTRAIQAQLEILSEAIALDERDRGVIWLPLSHDMGLFGGLLTFLRAGADGLLTTPERFLGAPRTWLDDCAAFGATLTSAPAMALAMAARAARTAPPKARLRLRGCIVGGDMLHAETVALVAERLGPHGLGPAQLVPAYGLAEATLAVTVSALGEAPAVRPAPGEEGAPTVSAGRPLRGVEVRAEPDDGVGEILVRSPSLAAGYLGDGAATAAAFHDGELRTGDLGFVADGELHVVGRADDVIKVGARKVWATAVEAAVDAEPGVRAGNSALVAVPGDAEERLAVVLESDDETSLDAVARRVARRALVDGGVGISECVFVRRGSLPKTPSGKVQRYRCRQLARHGGEAVVARVPLREPAGAR